MNKLEELKKLRNQMNLIVKNIENYPTKETNVLVANHNCLMDIFYLPMSLPEEIISLISARLVYKKEGDRKDVINKYLHTMPIEAHGGKIYTKLCLDYATKFLEQGRSISIFPEGAYVYDEKIFRGHTGASRMTYKARKMGRKVNLIPVSIRTAKIDNLDEYKKTSGDVEITFLPAIDYEESYYGYKHADSQIERNRFLHQPIDIAMKTIASNLNIPYENNYIELRAKGNVIFEDGSTVDVYKAQNAKYITRYNEELETRVLKLSKMI